MKKRGHRKIRPCSKRCENCNASHKQKPSIREVVLNGVAQWLCVDCEAMLSITQEVAK